MPLDLPDVDDDDEVFAGLDAPKLRIRHRGGTHEDVALPRLSMLDQALLLARAGWSVFPIFEPLADGSCSCGRDHPSRDTGKHPRNDNGCSGATTKTSTIRAWWTKWPNANIGIATGKASGIVVVDVDPRHGGTVDGLPSTGCVALTGGGGFHFVYRYPADAKKVANQVNPEDSADPERRGRDVRADGGYIVAPPSVHANGSSYAWESFDVASLGEPPAWAVSSSKRAEPQTQRRAPQWTTDASGPIPEGKRDDTMTMVVGGMAGDGLRGAGLRAAAHAVNEARCVPPLPAEDVERIVRSIESRAKSLAWQTWRTADKLKEKTMRWVLRGFIAAGRLHDVSGREGAGKSTIFCDLVSRLSRGSPLYDGTTIEPVRTLWITSEEDPEEDLRPRLRLMDANLSHITIVTPRDLGGLDLSRASEQLGPAIDGLGIGFVVIDPLKSFTGRADDWREHEMRPILDALAQLAMEHDVAIIYMRHWRKARGSASDRGSGTVAFTAAARVAMVVAKDPKNEDEVLWAVSKSNRSKRGTAWRFRFVTHGENLPATCALANDVAEFLDPDELADPSDRRKPEDPIAKALRETLTFVPRDSAEIVREVAAKVGRPADEALRRACQRRAEEMGVVITLRGRHTDWSTKPPEESVS